LRPLAPPTAIACAFEHPHYEVTLRLRPDGPAAIKVWLAGARVVIPQEPQGGVWVDVERPELKLGAWMRADELVLFAARPLVFGGWLSANGSTPLRWRAYRAASLWIAAPQPANVRLLEPLERRTDCGEVSLSRSFFDPEAPFDLPHASRGLLAAASRLELRAEIDGEEVAYLTVPAPVEVQVYERTPRRVRIGVHVDEGAIVAWLDASAVGPAPPSHGAHTTRPPAVRSDVGRVEPMGELLRCRAELALGVEAGDERALVGSVAAGTLIKLVRREAALAQIELPDASPWVRRARDARWLVPLEQLAASGAAARGCEPVGSLGHEPPP
jgi:hypothetical protein